MVQAATGGARVLAACAYAPRKRVTSCLILLIAVVFTGAVLCAVNARLPREDRMEQTLAKMQDHIQFLQTLYQERQQEILELRTLVPKNGVISQFDKSITPELALLLKNISGTQAATGIQPRSLLLRAPFVLQLLPHLMNDPNSLRPAYHMKGNRNFSDIVLGIPTVRRDKESYLLLTLSHLIKDLRPEDQETTLIVVYIGETDLEYVVTTAMQIEKSFPNQVRAGLIEVISPSASFYPDLDSLAPTLGDSRKRFRWRTKQNLDALFLMAYAQTKGTYYLMLEDDVICKQTYMEEIKKFTAEVSVVNPRWFFIEYCSTGGIGKLFRSSDLLHFITYVQLFYHNLPIDWLLESYLADRICTIEKASKDCKKNKLMLRPKYSTSLFQHIGLYSSLKGKIQRVKDPKFQTIPTYYPHSNPSVENVKTSLKEHGDHTLIRAYDGYDFFWGIKPKKGDTVEFWFTYPVYVKRYTLRSGNLDHVSDKFYDTAVEVMTAGSLNFTKIGAFDEFGMADGILKSSLLPITALRLRVQKDSLYWAILSEIDIQVQNEETA